MCHPRRWLRGLVLAAAFVFAHSSAHATTVVPPSFAELVAQSESIVRGRVTNVRAARVESPHGSVIKTYVTVAVLKQLKGTPARELTLELLGGELADDALRVEGMPQFAVGRVEILFISGNGVRFSPLVAMMHGRYRVLTDPATSREYIARNDGVPLESEHEVQLPQTGNVLEQRLKSAAVALTPAAFEQRITTEISRRAALP
jgi:hypothetical protein